MRITREQIEADITELERARDRLQGSTPPDRAARAYLERIIERRRRMLVDFPNRLDIPY